MARFQKYIFSKWLIIIKKKLYLNKIQNNFNSEIAIRSSSSSEDGIHNSNAGMFKSFLKIDINNKKK